MIQRVRSLRRDALREYTPFVESILRSRSRDAQHIEHTLDGLLDFCDFAPVLELFKALCRHYSTINPSATVSYINFYREMFDPRKARAKKPAARRSRTRA